jgi:hypothetical protein
VGYKKSITEMTDADNELMNIHMNNLLNAISKDSSKFFEIKGESHPVHACEFGYAPNLVATAENILDFVLS